MALLVILLLIVGSIVTFWTLISAAGFLGFFAADFIVGIAWLVFRWWARWHIEKEDRREAEWRASLHKS